MRQQRQRGTALGYALIIITGVTIVSGTAILYGLNSASASTNLRARSQLRGVAQAGIAEATHQLWDKYLYQTSTGQAGTAKSYQTWLNSASVGVGAYAQAGLANGSSMTFMNTTIGTTNLVVTLGYTKGGTTLPGRQDASNAQNGTYLNIQATASNNNNPPDSVILQGQYLVGAAPWNGLDFALLTNNVNCIFCHAHFDNAARYYNTSSANYGTFPAVRVAALQTVSIRTSQMNANSDSTIAGTFYSTNSVYSDDNNALVPAGTANGDLSYPTTSNGTGPNLQFMQLDSNGNIMQNSTGKMYLEESSNTTTLPSGMATLSSTQTTPTNGMSGGVASATPSNVYLNYPTNTAAQADGQVPLNFPPVVPNASGDKYVDPADWTSAVSGLAATNAAAGQSGTLTAIATQVPFGSSTSTTSTSLLTGGSVTTFGPGYTDLNAGASSLGTNSTGANVVLYGTAASPITISGTVAFPGDVVIAGVVQGTGEILVRGNLYVVSDLTYNDPGYTAPTVSSGEIQVPGTARNFGNISGTTGAAQNAVAYAAGGSVMIGNYIDSFNGGSTLGNNQMSFSEASIFNRDEWARTQTRLPSSTSGATVSNVPPSVIDPGTGVAGTNANGTYTPGYTPRFFTQSDGNVYIATNIGSAADTSVSGTSSASNYSYIYSPTAGWYIGNASIDIPGLGDTQALSTQYLGTRTISQDGSVSSTAPTKYLDQYASTTTPPLPPAVQTLDPGTFGTTPTQWMSRANLDTFTQNVLLSRTSGRPLEIDGMIYTNNSIYAMAGVKNDHTNGYMVVNGALISANTGILAPYGLQLNYDSNTKQYLNITDNNSVSLLVGWLVEK